MSGIDIKKHDGNLDSGVPYDPADFDKTHAEAVAEAVPLMINYVNGLLYLEQNRLAAGKAVEVFDRSNSIEWHLGIEAAVQKFRQIGWRITLSAGKYYFYLPEKKDGE